MNKRQPFKIALICNNLVRELGTLSSLKGALEKQLDAEVKIIGSLAEIQRTYYSLYKFQPHIVFLSQLQEKCCRDIAAYVKKSGGMVVVMPEEITPAKVVESLILNPDFTYDHLVDLVCLPGKVMESFFNKTDIAREKIRIVGAPKMDIELQGGGISRDHFMSKFAVDLKKKNVFIFTSFPHTGMAYFQTDECFKGNLKLIADIQTVLSETREIYLRNLSSICSLLSGYNVILKPHPLEELKYYTDIKAPNLYIISGVSVLDCLDSIDVAIHWNSTVSVSCWLHDVPTLQYAPVKRHNWLLSGFASGNPLISDYRKLLPAVEKYSKAKNSLPKKYLDAQKQYFQDNFYKVDGKSVLRIAKMVKLFSDQKSFDLSYTQNFSYVLFALDTMEKILGVSLSRKLLTMLFPYNWRYAVDNYLP